MTIYSNSSRPRRYTHFARNIYKQHHGSIPKDIEGRSYDIHHADGNRYNNDPVNLIAVTIQEHYQIHSSLQDWGACYAIAVRMKMSHDELSALATKNGLRRVADGTHPWSGERGSIHSKKVQKERIAAGTHPFLKPVDETHPTQKHWCCEHCAKEGKGGSNYRRWHGDSCKFKPG